MATLKELCDLDLVLYNSLFQLFRILGLTRCRGRVYLSNMIYMVMKEGIQDYQELVFKTSLACEVKPSTISAAIRYAKKRAMYNADWLYQEMVGDSGWVSSEVFLFSIVAFVDEYDFIRTQEKGCGNRARCFYRSHIDETHLIEIQYQRELL